MTNVHPEHAVGREPRAPDAGGAPTGPGTVVRAPGPQERDPERWLRRRRWVDRSLAIGVPVVLVVAWEVAARAEWIDDRYYASPWAIADRAVTLARDGDLGRHAWASTKRVLLGFGLGASVGTVVGLVLARSRLLRAAFEPLLHALYVVPKLAILPILFLIVGIGELSKVLLIAIAVFFVVAISTFYAALLTPPGFLEVGQSFGASRWKTFRSITLPAALPQITAGWRLASGISVLMLVGAEFSNTNEGLGYLVWHSWNLFLAEQMYVGIVGIALLGVLFSGVVKWIGGRIAPWAPKGDVRDEVI